MSVIEYETAGHPPPPKSLPVVHALADPAAPVAEGGPQWHVFVPQYGMNSLVRAAHPLLEIGFLLREAPPQPPMPLEMLRDRLVSMVRDFVDGCNHVDMETVAAARYCLCTFVDEAVGANSWGGEAWSTRSLLVMFHGEASGGERFFTILHRLSQNPAANIDALELLYVMLALGMQGRYRLSPGGAVALDQVRDKLRALIAGVRGAQETALSPRWRGDKAPRRMPWPARPMSWMVVGLACGLLSLHGWLDMRLQRQARVAVLARESVRITMPLAVAPSPVGGHMARAVAPAPSPAAGPFGQRLADRLSADVAAQRVQVDLRADRAIITIDTDGLFASGSARVAPAYVPLIRRIGDALRDVPGQVVVVGHTDNQPPATGAPSNWTLSLTRATQVVELLREQTGEPQRFLAQGKGDSDPIAANDTSAGQARNRRVVITVLAPEASM
jgi:type VI secretion system protein ImpK